MDLTVRLLADVDAAGDVTDVVGALEYRFHDPTGAATVVDTDIIAYAVEDPYVPPPPPVTRKTRETAP